MVVDFDIELIACEHLRRDPQIVTRLRSGAAEIGRGQQTHGRYRAGIQEALRDDVAGQWSADGRAVGAQVAGPRIEDDGARLGKITLTEGNGRDIQNTRRSAGVS